MLWKIKEKWWEIGCTSCNFVPQRETRTYYRLHWWDVCASEFDWVSLQFLTDNWLWKTRASMNLKSCTAGCVFVYTFLSGGSTFSPPVCRWCWPHLAPEQINVRLFIRTNIETSVLLCLTGRIRGFQEACGWCCYLLWNVFGSSLLWPWSPVSLFVSSCWDLGEARPKFSRFTWTVKSEQSEFAPPPWREDE